MTPVDCVICARPFVPPTPMTAPICLQWSCQEQRKKREQAPTPKKCRLCLLPMMGHTHGDVCGQSACQKHQLQQRFKEQNSSRVQRLALKMQAELQALQTSADVQGGIELLAIPSNTRELTPLSDERRDSFAQHLAQLLQELAETTTHEPEHLPETDEGRAVSVLENSCRTCQGFCCLGGNDRAYLKVSTLERVFAQSPTLHPKQNAARYMEYLPQETYEDSCIFHAAQGCALPPEMRSATCHAHLCAPLRDFFAQPAPPKQWMFAISSSGASIVRMALFDDQNYRKIPPSSPPPPKGQSQ